MYCVAGLCLRQFLYEPIDAAWEPLARVAGVDTEGEVDQLVDRRDSVVRVLLLVRRHDFPRAVEERREKRLVERDTSLCLQTEADADA